MDAFEDPHDFRLPPSYRAFLKVFGPGEFNGMFRVAVPGGPKHFNHYPWGWTNAGNTPFRRWKRETYRGGACDPFIVSWPRGIAARGEVRTQYAHIIDMVPTVLDMLGIEPPASIKRS